MDLVGDWTHTLYFQSAFVTTDGFPVSNQVGSYNYACIRLKGIAELLDVR